MKNPTKAQQRVTQLEKENTLLFLALSDQLSGKVKWFTCYGWKLGVSRETQACGGVVQVQGLGQPVTVYYWEEFVLEGLAQIQACITGEDNEYDRDLLRRRSLIEAAQTYVREQLAAR